MQVNRPGAAAAKLQPYRHCQLNAGLDGDAKHILKTRQQPTHNQQSSGNKLQHPRLLCPLIRRRQHYATAAKNEQGNADGAQSGKMKRTTPCAHLNLHLTGGQRRRECQGAA